MSLNRIEFLIEKFKGKRFCKLYGTGEAGQIRSVKNLSKNISTLKD